MGFSLSDPAARPLLARYTGGEATRRYYQDAAIRAVLEKIVRCEKTSQPKRALLSLATGSGKTFIAVNLLKRIADAGQLRRALFVCDRDELRSQGSGAFQNVFGANAASVTSGNPQKNARILIATYQTLDVDAEEATANFLTVNYPENYFSHIIIDECHRSAWGKWSQVLTRNPDAVQVGLTATPRRLVISEKTKEGQGDAQITADNIRHFGEPVYEYDMSQGIEDGYWAACEIQKSTVNLDDTGITNEDILARNPRDAITGKPVSADDLRALYEKTSYEDRILLPDRVIAMCEDLFKFLLATGGPEQNVTNISKYDVFVMGARLRKPKAVGHVLVHAHDSDMYDSKHMIPQGAISDLRFDFFVQPPVREKGKPFKADVAIVDQFGNEHWLKGLEFSYT